LFLSPVACSTTADVPIDAPLGAPDADLGGAFDTFDAGATLDSGGLAPSSVPPVPTDDGAAPPPPGDSDASSAAEDAGAAPGDAADAADDAPPPGACASPIGPGDLVIDELMIAAVAGTGDHGEWLEVRSTRPCALDIVGLHGECPTGAKVVTFDQLDDLWIPAYGSFLVADSSNPAIEHDLPGALLTWSGDPGDVLRNKGTTITLSVGGVIIDALTYPALKLVNGASYAYPADCAADTRSDFMLWQVSASSWFPGFMGTPNAPNVDVHCPH
jgi:hypothetical protein